MIFKKNYSVNEYYYIVLQVVTNNQVLHTNVDHLYWTAQIVQYISQYCEMTVEDYETIMLKYNADKVYEEYHFTNVQDVEEAINYLNETYTVAINLIQGSC